MKSAGEWLAGLGSIILTSCSAASLFLTVAEARSMFFITYWPNMHKIAVLYHNHYYHITHILANTSIASIIHQLLIGERARGSSHVNSWEKR